MKLSSNSANAAKQQTYGYRNMQSAGEPGDDDKHHHPDREFREHRHGEKVIPDEADRVGQHIPTVPSLQRTLSGVRVNQLSR